MSAHIDHVSLAKDFIAINDIPADHVGAARIAIAQVHATLALVEQQRIANLIAMGQFTNGDRTPPLMHIAVEAVDEYMIQPVAAIREGLGL